MKQSRLMSLVESWVNVVVGFVIAALANYYILPVFGLMVSVRESFEIAVIFTAISIIRSYIFRRIFEHIRVRHATYRDI